MVKKGKAYVDDQSPEEVSKNRGSWTEPGVNSPCRNRPVEENLDLLERMKNGEFPDGSRTLRAKIDMAHGNMNMRDPIMYRIMHEPPHHRTGKKWCIYPMYDWAQGQNDAMHGVTHSLCSIEYEDHRLLYDWYLKELEIENPPRQIEFARLNLNYTVMSKRKLRAPGEGKHRERLGRPAHAHPARHAPARLHPRVDPRFRRPRRRRQEHQRPRRRDGGYGLLEACIREELNRTAPRKMAVLNPLKVVIDNYPEGQVEEFEAVNNPEDPSAGTRKVPFSKVLYIEQDDFREVPPPKFFRLSPGREVRLRYAYFLKCESVVKDAQGKIVELHCTIDPPRAAAMPPMGARSKPPSIGSPPPMPCRPKCACTTGCSTTPTPRSAVTSSRTSTPTR